MKYPKSLKWLSRSRINADGGAYGARMRRLQLMGILCTVILFIVYRTTIYQQLHSEIEDTLHSFEIVEEPYKAYEELKYLPRGIVQARSDLELRPLWLTSSLSLKPEHERHRNLLAISAGIKQKENVDVIVQKFISENFTVMLFHYDCNVDGWKDLEWNNKAIHIVAHNQTKWWFAKRFLHPDVISIYDYIFIWDEDLGVKNFHPGRYLKIMKSEGLEISQPALDPDLSEVHHRITIRKRKKKVHRRIYETRGSVRCSEDSKGPPCTGWVEGMAPVFSRSAWRCAWHLIQNDLVHGWGMDMKLGYCAQGDRTKKVGIIDGEFIVHQGVQTLGGSYAKKVYKDNSHDESMQLQRRSAAAVDVRSEIRRQSTSELNIFKKRWEKAAREDKNWADPYKQSQTQSLRFI
ncbi:Lysine ketoglutarate reductase trans-splicing-related protein [Thalictrum thalictroides]|uniref:Lysine ketoglutarate reductase trans-splicing-related protein n=1 Tax=Thalictrum thalictroides TaxID=46969 RepID=A0A7J6VC39_THATH|nr:Lysine ketoglutarate reductase trans-splicing-related protein [Thalictrum thalictroides]